ncbi:helix-turn-helix transcriptional regulator [Nocardia asteroides NBRC 15531]|uniref:helix-turn-helix transcriptional regulator n=1 Tax=Nocardia asteroides TaxID=1824 RepID=UPI0002FEBCF1|nr:LuxR C-terminal-related transcriptional regulator [Nocardia asteroides]TLF66583.1 helix-turn-helix transcriptional regulator [Nocardia asteroides NBRC 15531]UGT46318.1 LuxR C-terminal-related transcriptional regulator [Nocardia asteroides]SFM95228.1 Tetratricopeptide repeat-containing protein [Nocardia asteroides]VEG34876.1 transcriptional regulator MalT [Nocardia asteroides]
MGELWRLLDRPVEYDAVRAALTNGGAGGVVLVGAAGIGKTTLARLVGSQLPAPVRWVACTASSQAIPLGAFAPWIAASASRDPLALLHSARENMLDRPGTVIGVDDAHLLDTLSATLVHQIAVDRSARIVATVRSGEPVPDAITSLWKDGFLERVELEPLTKRQCVALVETVLGGTLEGLSADVMWESSGGNPLFLRNMVEGAVEARTLTDVHGVWQLRGPTAVPSGLVDLLDERLARAGEPVLSALRMLAVYEPLDIDILTELVGVEAVDAAELTGLIRVCRHGPAVDVRFSHPLLGEVIRRRAGTAAARKRRGRIVETLRDRSLDTPADRIRLAQLCVDSDQPIDIVLLINAAKDAVALANLPLGERLARAACERCGGLRAAELLARALLWQGRPQEADEILARFDPDRLDQLQLVQWGLLRASLQFWSLGDVARGHELIDLLVARVQHPAARLTVDAFRAAMAVHENRLDVGVAESERVIADPNSPRQAVDFAAFALGLALPYVGRGAEVGAIAARIRAEQKSTDGIVRVMVRYGDVLALTMIGELDQAEQRASEYREFSSAGQFVGWAIARIAIGVVATCRGRFRAAIAAFEQALAALNAENTLPWQLPARLVLARAYAALGEADQAERVLADAEEHSGPYMALHEPQRLIARAWVAAAEHSQHAAIDLARKAADLAHRTGQFAQEAEALHHATRFGDRTLAPRLAAVATRLQGPAAAIYARHAAALAHSDTAALAAVSVEFENLGMLLAAADAAAQAVPIFDHAGRRRPSAEAAARAVALAARCDGAGSPAITAAARPLPITEREREIAALIGRGLSNRAIAERLCVSVRTVEGHIYRACIKLDASDRDQLSKLI